MNERKYSMYWKCNGCEEMGIYGSALKCDCGGDRIIDKDADYNQPPKETEKKEHWTDNITEADFQDIENTG